MTKYKKYGVSHIVTQYRILVILKV